MYATHLSLFRGLETKYNVEYRFGETNKEHSAHYLYGTNKIVINFKLMNAPKLDFIRIAFHEWAHFWMNKRGPDIRGIHGEYLADYLGWLVVLNNKNTAHKEAINYKLSVEKNPIYPKIKYSFDTLQKAKHRLEGESYNLRKIYEDIYK